MNRILVNACLLGDPVRYDGGAKEIRHRGLAALIEAGRVVAFCPEVAGGLPVPRPAAEIIGGDGAAVLAGSARVATRDGTEVTEYFLAGAQQALALCRRHDIRVAVMTESSPSCGSGQIYDGSFTRSAVAGSGVAATLLRQHGIEVFNQHQLDRALSCLESGNNTAAPRAAR